MFLDTEDVHKRAAQVTVTFDKDEICSWFQQIEHQMRILAIKSQEWKKITHAQNLPKDVAIALHDFIIADNSPTVYKDLKERISRDLPLITRLDECRVARFAQLTRLPPEMPVTIRQKMCDKGDDMLACCAVPAITEKWLSLLQGNV